MLPVIWKWVISITLKDESIVRTIPKMRLETQKVPVIIPTHIHQKEKAPGVAKRSVTIVWHASRFLSWQTFWKFATVSPTKKYQLKRKKPKNLPRLLNIAVAREVYHQFLWKVLHTIKQKINLTSIVEVSNHDES